jgi:hypothetical protein
MELLRPIHIEVEPHLPPDLRRVVRAEVVAEEAVPARCRSATDDGGGVLMLTRTRQSEEEVELLREATPPLPPLRHELAPAPGRSPPAPRRAAVGGSDSSGWKKREDREGGGRALESPRKVAGGHQLIRRPDLLGGHGDRRPVKS